MNRPAKPPIHHISAAVLGTDGGLLAIEPVELRGPRDDEVLVRLVASGICHTDISFVDSWSSSAEPIILGHEGAGVVEDVGKGVTGINVGDHVVLSYQSCGFCHECLNNHPAGCSDFYEVNFGFCRLDGTSAYEGSHVGGHFFGQSSFATHTVTTTRNTVKVASNLNLHMLAPLGCGIQTGAGTVINSLKVPRGSGIVIFGTGSVGLAGVMAAHYVGAQPIIAVDVIASRLELAMELGATHSIDAMSGDVRSRIASIAKAGVDFAIDNTGDNEIERIAVKALKPGGVLALLAGAAAPHSLPGKRRALSVIQGDAVPQVFIPWLIDLYKAGQFPFDRLITFYDFSDINSAIDDSRRGATIKPVLRIDSRVRK